MNRQPTHSVNRHLCNSRLPLVLRRPGPVLELSDWQPCHGINWMASHLPLPDSFYPLPASQAGFNLHQVIVIRLLRLVWLCPGNKAFDGVESPNLRLVSPGEMEGAKSPCSPVLQFSSSPRCPSPLSQACQSPDSQSRLGE